MEKHGIASEEIHLLCELQKELNEADSTTLWGIKGISRDLMFEDTFDDDESLYAHMCDGQCLVDGNMTVYADNLESLCKLLNGVILPCMGDGKSDSYEAMYSVHSETISIGRAGGVAGEVVTLYNVGEVVSWLVEHGEDTYKCACYINIPVTYENTVFISKSEAEECIRSNKNLYSESKVYPIKIERSKGLSELLKLVREVEWKELFR